MTITIEIQDPNGLTFEELKEALNTSLEDNGIDGANGNVDIEQSDDQPGDPEDVTENPPMPPGGPQQPPSAPPPGLPPGLGPTKPRPKSK